MSTQLQRLALIDDPTAYAVRISRRVRLAGELVTPGQVVTTTSLHLALRLVGCSFGVAADARTRLDVDLGLALQRAIPRPAPTSLNRKDPQQCPSQN